MPLYEYTCKKCDHTFETLVFGDDKVECPQCQGTRVEKLLSLPGIPQVASSPAPAACNSNGPSCGAPWCRKR